LPASGGSNTKDPQPDKKAQKKIGNLQRHRSKEKKLLIKFFDFAVRRYDLPL
jgi:hypothetical protein